MGQPPGPGRSDLLEGPPGDPLEGLPLVLAPVDRPGVLAPVPARVLVWLQQPEGLYPPCYLYLFYLEYSFSVVMEYIAVGSLQDSFSSGSSWGQ